LIGVARGIQVVSHEGGIVDTIVHGLSITMERGPAMVESLRAGRRVEVVQEPTLADALARAPHEARPRATRERPEHPRTRGSRAHLPASSSAGEEEA